MNASSNSENCQWREWPTQDDFAKLLTDALYKIKMLQSNNPFAKRFRTRSPRYISRLQAVVGACAMEVNSFGLSRIGQQGIVEAFNAIEEEFGSVCLAIEEDQALSYNLVPEELAECIDLASSLLATEKFLSGPDLDVLVDVVSNEIFNIRELLRIALNHGVWFETWMRPVR